MFVCRIGIIGWDIIHHPKGRLDAFELCQRGKVRIEQLSFRYGYTQFLVWFDSSNDRTWYKVSLLAFSSLFSDGTYIWVPTEVWENCSPNRRSREGASLVVKSGSALWWWNGTILVLQVQNITNQFLSYWAVQARLAEILATKLWSARFLEVHL